MLLPLIVLAHSLACRRMGWRTAGTCRVQSLRALSRPCLCADDSRAENAINADQVSHGLELGLAAVSLLTAALGFFAAYLFYYKKPGTLGARAANSALYRAGRCKVLRRRDLPGRHRHAAHGRSLASAADGPDRLRPGGRYRQLCGLPDAFTAGDGTRRMQSGNIRSYAGWLAGGAAAVILLMTYTSLARHSTLVQHLPINLFEHR